MGFSVESILLVALPPCHYSTKRIIRAVQLHEVVNKSTWTKECPGRVPFTGGKSSFMQN